MDGQSWVDDIYPVLQGSRTTQYNEAKLEVFKTGVTVDAKYMAIGLAVFIHGAPNMDFASIYRIHYGICRASVWDKTNCELQVDKLFNPLTLMVGPCLVIYLCFKSTKGARSDGFHLPAW
jgi:hypothetical protein